MDEKRIISTIKKVMPAVVSVVISKHLEDLEKEIPNEFYHFLPGHQHTPGAKKKFLEGLSDKAGMIQIGGGSGFMVDAAGLILTNKHVISEPKAEYTVIADDGRKFPAEILSRDPINDVAILKVVADNLPIVELADVTKFELGQGVIAIGNALGMFKNTVSLGIVSGLSRSIFAQADPKAPPQELRGLIQTDAAINPGNSGGPLVNLDGQAIGINTAIVFGAQNIGFAIPIGAAKRDLSDIKKYGRILKPLLGVRYIVIDENLKAKMKLSVDYGALVLQEGPDASPVVPGSPAEKAGIKAKDIILECNGIAVDKDHPIQDLLENAKVGDPMKLLVLRSDKRFEVKLTLAERK